MVDWEQAKKARGDGREVCEEVAWKSPAGAVQEHEQGTLPLAPPQLMILQSLSMYDQQELQTGDSLEGVAYALRTGNFRAPNKPRIVDSAAHPFCWVMPGDERHPTFPGMKGSVHSCTAIHNPRGGLIFGIQQQPASHLTLEKQFSDEMLLSDYDENYVTG
eukprot:3678069-Rhodomonas_salina.1